jgi:transcriptional regulator with XRE-family HTH domain
MKPDQAPSSLPGRQSARLAAARSEPAAVRIALGTQLRRLREDRNVTVAEAARVIRATHSKISRLERGRSGPKQRDVADLLSLYGVADEAQRAELLALARQASAPGWWQQYSDVVPGWFELYIGLERAAAAIWTYEVQFVHGLLQTEDYARAVVSIGRDGAPSAEIDRRVRVRMKRQQLLTQPDPPDLCVVLDEAALRRSPGQPELMRAQLDHLLQAAELPGVTLQIAAFGAGPHAAAGGPFTILSFPEPDVADLVYLEQLSSALYLDDPGDVASYLAVMSQLQTQVETEPASKELIRALLREAS